ncbi:MAG TPA: hypothetical protein VGC03_07660 [Acidimicrobiia bacterium]|jgi:hypothetical protein
MTYQDVGIEIPARRLASANSRRRVLNETMVELEHAVARPISAPGWLDRVQNCLVMVHDALRVHIEDVEGDDGLLEEILNEAPRLAPMAQDLEREHIALLDAYTRTEQRLRAAREHGPGDYSAVRRRVTSLLGRLTLHRQHGSDLVYEAYNVDIDAAD